MNVPHDLHSHDLTTRLAIIQNEVEPGPDPLTGSLRLGIRTPPLILRNCRDDEVTKRVREIPA